MCSTPVQGPPIKSKIYLVGQAPGAHESSLGRPFAYTAGKTLFKWIYEATGVDEETFREHVYMAAIARCFPGKDSKKGDRKPNLQEIKNCRRFIEQEVAVLQPDLVIAIGRVAIAEVLGEKFSTNTPLEKVVGKVIPVEFHGRNVEVICLPHPSGVSTWIHSKVGKVKLKQALSQLRKHAVWLKSLEAA